MLLQRLLTVLIAAPFLVAAILYENPYPFQVIVVLALLMACLEFFTMAKFSRAQKIFGLITAFFHISYLVFYSGETREFLLLETALIIMLIFIFHCRVAGSHLKGAGLQLSWMIAGIFYVGTLGSFVGLLKSLENGAFWIFIVLTMTWFNDTAAYFVGHWIGKTKLAETISPAKTLEGYLGGFLGTFLSFFLFWFLFDQPIDFFPGLMMALLVATVAPFGDLSESLLKRHFGVKDSGNLIPGHGGILDRIDALLFAAPIVYGFALVL